MNSFYHSCDFTHVGINRTTCTNTKEVHESIKQPKAKKQNKKTPNVAVMDACDIY